MFPTSDNSNNSALDGLRLTLGWSLDGQRASSPANLLGAAVLGPLGLLDILETRLGLAARHPSRAERIVQYRDCLQALDAEARFYHHSFATDPLGTAACLLDWRDALALHGWTGELPAQATTRLRDLAELEQRARTSVAANIGQRLEAVYAALQRRKPDIACLHLVDPLEVFPARWRSVLAALPVQPCSATALDPECGRIGQGAGFLGQLQQALVLAAADQEPGRLAWQNDGTVLVVQAETRVLAAHWIASRVALPSTLLVCPEDGARLDAYLTAYGHPRQGLKESSLFRPALQLLPLVTELLWEPLNYPALVQFLTHPLCPLPNYARHRLARKVADAPGIGGERWQQALDDVDRHYEASRAPAVRALIANWVEHPRFPVADGVPVAVVIERVSRLADFFQHHLAEPDTEPGTELSPTLRLGCASGHQQCRACLDALCTLAAQGTTSLRPRQLQKLVAEATGSGTSNPLWPAEVGAGRAISDPGAAIEPAARVIWWPLSLPNLPEADPWSLRERHALAQVGVHLPDSRLLSEQCAQRWLRPVMAAREQLVLVLPPPAEEVHPLWQMIEAVVEAPVITPLEGLLSAGGESMCALAPKPLPAPRRWWQLPPDIVVPLRPTESFSSLELLLFNPWQWLLRYPAGLRPSALVRVTSDFQLFGKLAHGLIERHFRTPMALAMDESAFEVWYESAFDTLIDQEGALLRMPGRGGDLAHFRHRLRHALGRLRAHLAQAGIRQVTPEQPLAGAFAGGALTGSADLVLQGEGGAAIVDMKWSGGKKYPEKLRHNRHLQLALYAELVRQQTGQWPAVAYYLLDQARLLTPDERVFADAEFIAADDGENTAQLWQRFLVSWCWRVAQVRAGRFEVCLDRIPETDASVPPATGLAAETLNETWNDYRTLAGWEIRA